MLPRTYRLTADKDISKVFRHGRSASAGPFALRFAPNGKERSRFAFVVGTKVSKKAVVRNRLKRQMREAVHAILDGTRAGLDIVVTARKEAIGVPFKEMSGAMAAMFRRAGILKGRE